jgi:hypothetical protein
MNDPRNPRPAHRVPPAPGPVKPAAAPARGAAIPPVPTRPGAQATPARPAAGEGATGKVVHDDRGNAVWDWLKTTSRHAIESTTRMLRKLETPELKMEDTKDEDLRIAPEPGSGGGYDPYNQAVKPRPGRK